MKKRYILLCSLVFSIIILSLTHTEIIDSHLFLGIVFCLTATTIITFFVGYFAGRNDFTKNILWFCNFSLLNFIVIPILVIQSQSFSLQQVANNVDDYNLKNKCYPNNLQEANSFMTLMPNDYNYTKIRCDSAVLKCSNLEKTYDFTIKKGLFLTEKTFFYYFSFFIHENMTETLNLKARQSAQQKPEQHIDAISFD